MDTIEFGKVTVARTASGEIVVASPLCGGGKVGANVAVAAVTGIDDALRPVRRALPRSEDLSRSRASGLFTFVLPGDGLYVVSGYPRSSSAVSDRTRMLSVQGGEAELVEDERTALESAFPVAYAHALEEQALRKAAAEKLEARVAAAREEFAKLVPETGSFRVAPEGVWVLVEATGGCGCGHRFTVKGYFPEKVAEAYREAAGEACDACVREEHRRKEVEAARKAQAKLPALKGTSRQVDWALKIRAAYIARFGETDVLRTQNTARYWIDSFKHLA